MFRERPAVAVIPAKTGVRAPIPPSSNRAYRFPALALEEVLPCSSSPPRPDLYSYPVLGSIPSLLPSLWGGSHGQEKSPRRHRGYPLLPQPHERSDKAAAKMPGEEKGAGSNQNSPKSFALRSRFKYWPEPKGGRRRFTRKQRGGVGNGSSKIGSFCLKLPR